MNKKILAIFIACLILGLITNIVTGQIPKQIKKTTENSSEYLIWNIEDILDKWKYRCSGPGFVITLKSTHKLDNIAPEDHTFKYHVKLKTEIQDEETGEIIYKLTSRLNVSTNNFGVQDNAHFPQYEKDGWVEGVALSSRKVIIKSVAQYSVNGEEQEETREFNAFMFIMRIWLWEIMDPTDEEFYKSNFLIKHNRKDE